MSKIQIEVSDEDCLHCYIWAAVHHYCEAHPNGYVQDVVEGLAAVMGDQLASPLSRPHTGYFKQVFLDRVDERIEAALEARAGSKK